MGSWEDTCAISHLPISFNERVKILFLGFPKSRELHFTNYNFPDACPPHPILWEAIPGTYQDYGEYTLEPTPADKLFRGVFNRTPQSLLDRILLAQTGEKRPPRYSLDYELKRIGDGGDYVTVPDPKVVVGFVPVLEEVWKELLKGEMLAHRAIPLGYPKKARSALELREFCRNEWAFFAKSSDPGELMGPKSQKNFWASLLMVLGHHGAMAGAPLLVANLLEAAQGIGDIEPLLDGLSDVMFVRYVMSAARRIIAPQPGAGSQDWGHAFTNERLDSISLRVRNAKAAKRFE